MSHGWLGHPSVQTTPTPLGDWNLFRLVDFSAPVNVAYKPPQTVRWLKPLQRECMHHRAGSTNHPNTARWLKKYPVLQERDIFYQKNLILENSVCIYIVGIHRYLKGWFIMALFKILFLLIFAIVDSIVWLNPRLFLIIFIVAAVCLLIGLIKVYTICRAILIIALGVRGILALFCK